MQLNLLNRNNIYTYIYIYDLHFIYKSCKMVIPKMVFQRIVANVKVSGQHYLSFCASLTDVVPCTCNQYQLTIRDVQRTKYLVVVTDD